MATFSPPLPGGTVYLDKLTAKGWQSVARSVQNDAGAAFFDVTPGVRYRATTGRGAGAARTTAVEARAFELKFAEDFDRAAADGRSPQQFADQWRPAVPGRTCASLSSALRNVSGGVLHLRTALDASRPEACAYTSGDESGSAPHLLNTQVATSRTFAFTHGYAAARIKMHRHGGAHAGFWLLPAKLEPDDLPEWHDSSFVVGDPSKGVEIDVVEYWANRPANGNPPTIGSFLHWYASNANGRESLGAMYAGAMDMRGPARSWSDDFHVFSVRWSPTSYEFMVDGQVFARHTRAVSQVPQYPVLSMLSSDYELGWLETGLFSDSAQVDWVRVWSL